MKSSILLLTVCVVFIFCPSACAENILTSKKILLIAEQTDEVRVFYDMRDGSLFNCIEQSVKRSEEGDMSEDGADWEVVFFLGETCGLGLSVPVEISVFLDSAGKVIGSKPNVRYFEELFYCERDEDCYSYYGEDSKRCSNYVSGQLRGDIFKDPECVCLDLRCGYLMSSE